MSISVRVGSVTPSRRRFPGSTDSPKAYSFGQSARFRSVPRNPDSLRIDLPTTLAARSTSFGLGQRWTPMNPGGKDSPPPGSYVVWGEVGEKGKGFSFGERRFDCVKRELPGPGSYRVTVEPGKDSPKFSMRARRKGVFYPTSPPPNAYRPSTTLTQDNRFQSIGFGYGDRRPFYNKATLEFPGPGAYQGLRDLGGGRELRGKRVSVTGEALPAI